MNPFQLSPPPPAAESLRPLDAECSATRMMRLHADLTALASGLDIQGWSTASIVQTPNRLQVSSQGSSETITPLLAAALLADIERTMVAAEQVRSRLSPDWRAKLIAG